MKYLNQEIQPNNSEHCKACGLYLNQLPISDKKRKVDVFWVGLSAVQIDESDEMKIPLAPTTRSGKLIQALEQACFDDTKFYKTNLVKCLPLNENKIRYPELLEMNKCYPNLINELNILNPKIVFLLGKQVAKFVLKKYKISVGGYGDNFQYETYLVNNVLYVPIHHPSYILVYKRKSISDYVDSIKNIIENTLISEQKAV